MVVAAPAAGADLPAKRVLFFDAGRGGGRALKAMENRQYRSIVAEAAGPEHGWKAEAIVVAITDAEHGEYQKAFWREPDLLRSPLFDAGRPGPAAALRSQLLGHVADHPGTGAREILASLRGAWPWSPPRPGDWDGIARSVESSLDDLAGCGMLARDGGRLRATDLGRLVSESAMLPDSAARIVAGLRCMPA